MECTGQDGSWSLPLHNASTSTSTKGCLRTRRQLRRHYCLSLRMASHPAAFLACALHYLHPPFLALKVVRVQIFFIRCPNPNNIELIPGSNAAGNVLGSVACSRASWNFCSKRAFFSSSAFTSSSVLITGGGGAPLRLCDVAPALPCRSLPAGAPPLSRQPFWGW